MHSAWVSTLAEVILIRKIQLFVYISIPFPTFAEHTIYDKIKKKDIYDNCKRKYDSAPGISRKFGSTADCGFPIPLSGRTGRNPAWNGSPWY